MTILHLVRHGETVWHAENRYAGVSDISLTPRGLDQAESLGRWAAAAGLDAVYASTLSRAIETARPAASATGLELVTDADLVEVDFGLGEGLTRTEMAERFPSDLSAFLARPAENPLPNGEQGLKAIRRSRSALDRVVAGFPDGRVLIVTHSTLVRLLICSVAAIDPNDYRRVFPHIGNCALNTLLVTPEGTSILGLNVPTE
ncbi:MAG: histidine phosphatase family protein [Actinomycetota bacterium]|nr:histidine phosphatase family protein [Actinomycetota bacterium]